MFEVLISFTLSLILASFAYVKKAMTKSALILSFISSFIITYYGGIFSFIILASVFLGTVIAGKIKSEKRKSIIKEVNMKGHKKDIASIFVNVIPGTIALIIYGITQYHIFLVIYVSVMAEAISDSLASDIGVLSKKEPINILTLKKGKPGISGNISFLGIIASFIGSFTIAAIYFLYNHNLIHFLIIIFCSFFGSIIDSFLGALIQVKYKCPKCHIITEKNNHCETKTELYKGYPLFNNDTINLLSNILSGVICYLILIC